jgi:uncharacterized phage infection (PIP) family protein YhgE
MADLNSEMVDLRIYFDEAVTNAKDSREKLVALIEHARMDQEEAQGVKSKRDELLWASGQLQSELELFAMSASMLLVSATRLSKSAT